MSVVRVTPIAATVLFWACFSQSTADAQTPQAQPAVGQNAPYKSPVWVIFGIDGRRAYVSNHTSNSVAVIDTERRGLVAEIPTDAGPMGLICDREENRLYVANRFAHTVTVIDLKAQEPIARMKVGFEPIGLALSSDGKTLYVANFISDDVSVVDTAQMRETTRIPVGRAPFSAVLTPDGRLLMVANTLPGQPSTDPKASADVTVIDTASNKVLRTVRGPGAMLSCRHMAVSADGKWSLVPHLAPNANVPTTQLLQGWIQTNAITMFPVNGEGGVATVLLDGVYRGAANPCGLAVSPDGNTVYVSHSGVHTVSIVDLKRLTAVIGGLPSQERDQLHARLGFLQRHKLLRQVPTGGEGPRGIALRPGTSELYVTNYFSDSIGVIDTASGELDGVIPLGTPAKPDLVRQGEMMFHDARNCFQTWLSCASCHPDTRADGLNWDLVNDGMGNAKNTKSLVGSHATPPVMVTGIRPDMETAVDKGFRFIQFHTPSKALTDGVIAYLRAVPFVPSPHLNPDRSMSEAANRGRRIFDRARCKACHPPPLYTDQKIHIVGTQAETDFQGRFDTPALTEGYRTAPYLHDGRAVTLKEVLTTFNRKDRHGKTQGLSESELDDLVAFLKSL